MQNVKLFYVNCNKLELSWLVYHLTFEHIKTQFNKSLVELTHIVCIILFSRVFNLGFKLYSFVSFHIILQLQILQLKH